jgi:hypothetical protein
MNLIFGVVEDTSFILLASSELGRRRNQSIKGAVVKDCANCRHNSVDRRVAFTRVLKLDCNSAEERLINFSHRER